MSNSEAHRTQANIEPDRTSRHLANLPSPRTARWVMERKVEVLAAVRSGLLSIDDACKRYAISMEEFLTWKSAMDRFGPLGLRATRDFRSERPG